MTEQQAADLLTMVADIQAKTALMQSDVEVIRWAGLTSAVLLGFIFGAVCWLPTREALRGYWFFGS